MTRPCRHNDREYAPVELVDERGTAIGSATVDVAHRAPGLLHRAFSVILADPAGRLLLQRRAASKTRFALHWANACCGHPAPGEAVATAAARRLAEELGVERVPLTEIGVYRYLARDPASGRIEHEYDHVLVGTLGHPVVLAPDPAEVAETRWIDIAELSADMAATRPADTTPDRYAPWLPGVVATWHKAGTTSRDAG